MNESPKRTKLFWRIAFGIACVAFIVSAAMLVVYLWPERSAQNDIVPPVSLPETSSVEELPDNPIDFASLQAENPDVVAWIQVPGTIIDYPVMSSGKGEDGKDFYINHNSDGEAHRAGAIYMQRYLNSSDFSDPNTVLYGHNMANGSMFSWLHQYKKRAFFDENRTIVIYTPGHVLTYEIYSAFLYDNRHILNSFNFYNDDDYAEFIRQTLHPSSMVRQVRDDVSVTTDSYILTLSTCNARDTERYLVIGVLTNDQRTN